MKQSKATLPHGSVSEQADYWLTLLNSPLADEQQQQAFQQWLDENAENRAAFAKARKFWQKMDTLTSNQIERLEQRLSSDPVVSGKPRNTLRPILQFNPWAFPAIACLLWVVVFGLNEWPCYFADYRTDTGEQKTIQLSDGSTIVLNTESALSVDYSKFGRTLTLHSGEAYFKVAPDAERPFDVNTENSQVRALGTAFDVKSVDGDMTVTVYQHAVSIAFRQGEVINHLQEGERLAFKNKQATRTETVDLQQAGSWRKQRLVFSDQPLDNVIAELNRYRPGKIIILDNQLAKHLVTGVFDPYDTEAALSAIEKTLNVKEYRLTDRLVLLTHKENL